MPLLESYHEVRFPTGVAMGSSGGPQRRTEIVTLGSGFEQRNARWQNSRRHYEAGYGVKNLDDLYAIISFFEERRGALFGFRFKDSLDALITAFFWCFNMNLQTWYRDVSLSSRK